MPCATGQHSDSEDDEDYVPAENDRSDDDSDAEENPSHAIKAPHELQLDAEKQKETRDALWSSFQASITAPPTPVAPLQDVKTIKIQKRYLFAGKEVIDIVEVPHDSPEAKKWITDRDITDEDASLATDLGATRTKSPLPEPEPKSNSSSNLRTTTMNELEKRPGPRKSKKKTLASIPEASKAKKLTTLDKSAMDWRNHLRLEQELGVVDELEANRRSGGYLEKVDFLKRVDARKEENLDMLKSNKRRKF